MSGTPPPPAFLSFTLPLEGDEEELEKLKRKIERDRGFNCSFYKDKCLRRRIAVRMRARGQRTYEDYARVLDGDDANIDQTYDRDRMGPDEVGSHPASISPYGLYDTAGNAFEWVRGERTGTYVVRGGSFYHDRKTADLANRNETGADVHDPSTGLRLCATPR